MCKRIFLIVGMAILFMGNTTSAESMGKKPEMITNIDTSIEVKTILEKKMPASIQQITSSGVDSLSGKKVFGMKLKNGKFAVADDKGSVVFEKDCQDGKVSKDGKKVFLSFLKSTGKPEHEGYKEEYKLIQYDMKGNEQWEIESTLPIHLSENEQFVAEFKTWESESSPSFTLRDVKGNKILWQKNDFAGRWQGYLMNDGKLVVFQYKGAVSVYGLNGEKLWEYKFTDVDSLNLMAVGKKSFIMGTANFSKNTISVYAFSGEKGLLWQKKDFRTGVCIFGLSKNDKYCAVFKVGSKELFLFEMESGKEIYTVVLTKSIPWEWKLDVALDGKVAINYNEGTMVFDKEGKTILQRIGSKVNFVESDILLFKDSSFEAIELKEKK